MLRIAIPASEEKVFNYKNAIAASGAEPVVISTPQAEGFDALLLPGGGDIATARYGQENTASQQPDLALDALQFETLDLFVKAKKPVLGICRGHQLINVYFGGTLVQNIDAAYRHVRHEGQDSVHMNTALPGSFLAEIYGTEFPTNSSHHQAVDRLGDGLAADMHSDDGYIEGMHHSSLPVWSVQWHPERMCFAFRREDTVDGSLLFARWLKQLG